MYRYCGFNSLGSYSRWLISAATARLAEDDHEVDRDNVHPLQTPSEMPIPISARNSTREHREHSCSRGQGKDKTYIFREKPSFLFPTFRLPFLHGGDVRVYKWPADEGRACTSDEGYVGVASSVRREVVNHSGLRGRWRYIGPVSPRLMTKLLFSFVIFWRKGHSVRGSREDSPAEQAGRPLVREEGQQGSIQRTLQINTPSFSLSPCTFPYCSLECFVVDL
jgi:hypothetical protein